MLLLKAYTAGNTYVSGPVIAIGTEAPHNQNQVQQFWCLSSVEKAGNVVTATNAAAATPLNVSVVAYRSSAGTTWQNTASASVSTGYTSNPVTTSAFAMPDASVAVGYFADVYGISGSASGGADTKVQESSSQGWTLERIRATAAPGQTMTTSSGQMYTRTGGSVQVFQRT